MPAEYTTDQKRWPTGLLKKTKVDQVFVCERELEPPILSHAVNFPRLEIPLTGCYENQISLNGQLKTVQLRPGAALLAPPNCWNLPTWQKPVRLLSVLFGKKQLGISIVTSSGPDKSRLSVEKFFRPRPLTGPAPKILEAMMELQKSDGADAPLAELARALIFCLGSLYHIPESTNLDSAKSLLEQACVFLQSHYQYDATRESVARQFNVSPNYLSRIFQLQGHMTFSSYLMHVRIDRAKFLLRNYGLKLDDIAARCGYHDTAYFCRVFKNLTKQTPAEYRTNQKNLPGGPHLAASPGDLPKTGV